MAEVFIAIGFLTAIGGVFSLTKITAGVGCVCFGCFLLIMARIVIADRNHKEAMKQLDRLQHVQDYVARIANQIPDKDGH